MGFNPLPLFGKTLACAVFLMLNADAAFGSSLEDAAIADITASSIDVLRLHPSVNEAAASIEPAPAPPKQRGGVGQRIYRENVARVPLIIHEKSEGASTGSGLLIDETGLFLTNYHVVEGATEVLIFMHPGQGKSVDRRDGFVADVVAADISKDLALVRTKAPLEGFTSVDLAEPSTLDPGTDVFALGHPKGLHWSFTEGIVSQVRSDYKWRYDADTQMQATVIQTQTPINPGNSGGPLFNGDGKVIGINTFSAGSSQGLNFAVSITDVHEFLANPKSLPEPDTGKDKVEAPGGFREPDQGEGATTDAYGTRRPVPGRQGVWLYDLDGDGDDDAVGLDLNGNGRPETLGFDMDNDGRPETFKHDADEDGKFDVEGIDMNGDGKIDKVRPIA